MTADMRCPECGGNRRASVLDGLCPACVIRRSLMIERVVAIADSPIADRFKFGQEHAGRRLTVGDYEIESEIARGGMGVVYRARQLSLNRPVALKLLLAGQFADAGQVRRFRAEAAAVARLEHPAIVPVYEVGEFESRHFFSMRLIEGPSLATAMPGLALPASLARARRNGVSPGPLMRARQREIARFMAGISRAVHYAHQRGVLHRDLKPANVLLDAQGNPHVTDFGLARCLDDDSAVTGPGIVFGTPAYMPPEQTMDPHNVTVAADVYSLGAITYELLTGRPPFEAGTPVETVIQVREREPMAPRALEPEVDRDLETMVLKCLEKDPLARYANALALAEDLDRFTAGEPVLARPVGASVRAWRWARRHPSVAILSVAVTALLLALAIGGPVMAFRLAEERDQKDEVGVRYRRELQAARLAQARADRLRGEVLHREPGLEAVRDALKVGTNLSALNEAVAQLASFDISVDSNIRQRLLVGQAGVMNPDFSVWFEAAPAGAIQASSTRDDTLIWVQTNLPAGPVAQLRLSPDGQWLSVERDRRLTMLRAHDGALLWTTPANHAATFGPDGSWILINDDGLAVKRFVSSTGVRLPFMDQFSPLSTEFVLAPDPALPLLAQIAGNRVLLLNWEDGRIVNSLTHNSMVRRIAWQDHRIAVADEDGTIAVWQFPSRQPVNLRERIQSIEAIRFIPNTPYLLVITEDGQATCWDTDVGDRVLSSSGFAPEQVSADGDWLSYGTPGEWGVARVLYPVGRRRISVSGGADPDVRQIEFSSDARFMAVVRQAGVHLFDLRSDASPLFIDRFGAASCAFAPDTATLLVQGRSFLQWFEVKPSDAGPRAIPIREHRWEQQVWLQPGFVLRGQPLFVVPESGSGLSLFGLGDGRPNGKEARPEIGWVAGIDRVDPWTVFRRRSGSAPGLLNSLTGGVSFPFGDWDMTPRFSPDGRWLLASARRHHRVFNVRDWTLWRSNGVSVASDRSLAAGAWTPDSRHVALCENQEGVVLRDVQTWSEVIRLTTPQRATLTTLTFSPGGRWLATGTDQGSVELWDFVELGSELRRLGLSLGLEGSPAESAHPVLPRRVKASKLVLPGPEMPPYPPRDPDAGPAQLDLTRFYNAHLEHSWTDNNIFQDDASLSQLPTGLQRFNGVVFDVRGLIQLSGARFRSQSTQYPVRMDGIPVGFPMNRLHIVGAVVDAPRRVVRGSEMGWVRFNYRDGVSETRALILGRDLEDWWVSAVNPRRPETAKHAWRGMNPATERNPSPTCLELYHAILASPHPGKAVASIDLISADGPASPFIVALTAE